MIEKEEASLDDFDVEEHVPEDAEDGQLDEDARIMLAEIFSNN